MLSQKNLYLLNVLHILRSLDTILLSGVGQVMCWGADFILVLYEV